MQRLACCAVLAVAVLAVAAPAASAARRDTTPPTTPTNVRVVAVTEDSITIAWNASTDDSGKIHAYIAGGIYHDGNSTTKTFSWLVPNWTVTYRVQAMDAAGNLSALSEPVTGTTAPDVTPPTAPGNLRLTGSTPSSVSLAWDRATDRWSFAYRLFVDGVEAGGTGDLSFRLRHLAPGSTHTFTVRARVHSGNISPPSNAVTLTLQASADRAAPTAPTNLTALDVGDFCGGTELRWNPSSDDTDPASAIEYEVYRNGTLFTLTAPGAAFAGLYAPSGTSTWTVVAVDRAGNSSAASNAATVTVTADPNLC
jgi:chitodextrinase